jgi:hypothetical protein
VAKGDCWFHAGTAAPVFPCASTTPDVEESAKYEPEFALNKIFVPETAVNGAVGTVKVEDDGLYTAVLVIRTLVK